MTGLLDAAKVLLTHGGAFPYLNIIVLAVALAIIVERFIALGRHQLAAAPFMTQLVRLVREGKLDTARKLCLAAPDAVLARVIKAGLDRAHRSEAEVSSALEESVLEQSPLVTRRIPMLFPLANIATLFGLIGTISGLIKSFSALSSASPEQKSQILAIGISEAMYNTAFGLLIAVLCIAAQLFLANKAKGMIEEVEFNALKLENLLARRAAGDLESSERASA
jgi:biopolymer transport protein ExbB/TolQ